MAMNPAQFGVDWVELGALAAMLGLCLGLRGLLVKHSRRRTAFVERPVARSPQMSIVWRNRWLIDSQSEPDTGTERTA